MAAESISTGASTLWCIDFTLHRLKWMSLIFFGLYLIFSRKKKKKRRTVESMNYKPWEQNDARVKWLLKKNNYMVLKDQWHTARHCCVFLTTKSHPNKIGATPLSNMGRVAKASAYTSVPWSSIIVQKALKNRHRCAGLLGSQSTTENKTHAANTRFSPVWVKFGRKVVSGKNLDVFFFLNENMQSRPFFFFFKGFSGSMTCSLWLSVEETLRNSENIETQSWVICWW